MKNLIQKHSLAIFILLLIFVVLSISAGVFVRYKRPSSATHPATHSACNVQGIKIRGDLNVYIPKSDLSTTNGQLNVDETASEDIYQAIKKADANPNIKAILVDIDSQGGSGVAAQEIETALKHSNKPSVALIREFGESGAYRIATGANVIFASNISSIGKIGVNGSFLDNVNKNTQDGFTYHNITTGKYKDLGDPNKPFTRDDEKKMRKDMNIIFADFVKSVATNRKLSEAQVRSMADGSNFYGEEALKLGLIDKIGGLDDVNAYLKDKVLGGEEADVCW